MSTPIAGAVIAVAAITAMAGICAATTSAGFSTGETNSHTRSVDVSMAVKQAADESRIAHARCELLHAEKRQACAATARSVLQQAMTVARTEEDGDLNPTTRASASVPALPQVDLVLYRAHRQLHY